MAQYTAKRFGGSTPRLAPHLLGESVAGEARDCKLWHGTLDSWRELLFVRSIDTGVRTSYLYDCCWLDFDSCVDIAFGPVTCRTLFTTGDQEWPAAVEFGDDCAPTIRRLGVPCGDTAPAIVAAAGFSKDSEGRSYAYQYRNAKGEKGSLSQGSVSRLLRDGQSVVVSGWDVPDASWGVTHVLIYRTVSGRETGREPNNQLDTTWMLVGEVAVGAPSFTDTKFNDDLFEAIEQDIADPPPAALRGITYVESMNMLTGYVKNRLYFSENNSYHEWPYHLDLDDNICGIAENNGVLYVATDGAPYVVTAAVECKGAGCRKAVRMPVKFPMVGCGNRRMAKITQGVVYPTHDGLVAMQSTGVPELFTTPLYAPDDWHKLLPESVVPVAHNGFLFVFGRGGSFVLKLANGPETGWALDTHSTLSDTDVVDAFVSRTGDFYVVKPGAVYLWDKGDTLRPHHWVSPEIVSPVPIAFGAAHLYHKGGAENVTLSVDGREVINRPVLSARVFRLPMWADGTRWRVTLDGTATVSLFSMATSMKELGA